MRVNSVSNNSVRSYAQPSFKAQMNKEDIKIAIDTMKKMEIYNPHEMLPQLYTVLKYAESCPGDKLEFKKFKDSYTGYDFYTLNLDGEKLVHSDSLDGAWELLFRSYIESNAGITTHARMPQSVFEQKWFDNRCFDKENDLYKLAYDA